MIARRGPQRLPAKLDFGADTGLEAGWGRLETLAAAGAVVTTLSPLSRGGRLLLSFEVAGEPFKELRARVVHAERDDDGFCRAELDFLDAVDRRRLAACLLDVLSR